MLHFSCDLCGQRFNSQRHDNNQQDDQRFVVTLKTFPAFDPDAIDESNLDADHLHELAEQLDEMAITGESPVENCDPQEFRFDLCPPCYQQFLKDPLGRKRQSRLNFSEN